IAVLDSVPPDQSGDGELLQQRFVSRDHVPVLGPLDLVEPSRTGSPDLEPIMEPYREPGPQHRKPRGVGQQVVRATDRRPATIGCGGGSKLTSETNLGRILRGNRPGPPSEKHRDADQPPAPARPTASTAHCPPPTIRTAARGG